MAVGQLHLPESLSASFYHWHFWSRFWKEPGTAQSLQVSSSGTDCLENSFVIFQLCVVARGKVLPFLRNASLCTMQGWIDSIDRISQVLFAPKIAPLSTFVAHSRWVGIWSERSQPSTSPFSASSSFTYSWGIATEDGPVSDSVQGENLSKRLGVCERSMDHYASSKSGRDYCGMSRHFTIIWPKGHNSA